MKAVAERVSMTSQDIETYIRYGDHTATEGC